MAKNALMFCRSACTNTFAMNEKAVFCTSLIDSDPVRYQNWINHYTEFFADCGIDLWMINDGPVSHQLDLKNVILRNFDYKLGRPSVWIFPGWKRSFFHGVSWLTKQYKYVGHIESDCWITEAGKSEFIRHLDREGYFTGFTPTYNFPETALQIINNNSVRNYFIDKYSCAENWHEDIDFEKSLKFFNPTYILEGDRIENNFTRFKPNFTFITGATYLDFRTLYGH